MDQAFLERVEEYLKHLEMSSLASPNTVSAYRNDLTQLCQYLETTSNRTGGNLVSLVPVDGAEDWSSVSRPRLVGFVVALKAKGYATTTVARKIAALKSFFHYLYTNGIISADPTDS